MNDTNDKITQFQLENYEFDKRVDRIELILGCPEEKCGNMNVYIKNGELHCSRCGGIFVQGK